MQESCPRGPGGVLGLCAAQGLPAREHDPLSGARRCETTRHTIPGSPRELLVLSPTLWWLWEARPVAREGQGRILGTPSSWVFLSQQNAVSSHGEDMVTAPGPESRGFCSISTLLTHPLGGQVPAWTSRRAVSLADPTPGSLASLSGLGHHPKDSSHLLPRSWEHQAHSAAVASCG